MRFIGQLTPRHANQIFRSRIGVGFECLDRQMWDDTPELYRLAGESGAKHARVQTGWFRCERGKGVYAFAWLDAIVDKLRAQGIQPWLSLSYGNRLYCPESTSDDCAGYPPLETPEARAGWCAFVEALVRHFSDRVTHYEIWNEPDCSGFWLKGPNAEAYMDLVALTSPVIRKQDPEAKVVGGALGRSISHWRAFDIIQQYLELGLVNHVDAFTFHRYHILPELNRPEDFRLLRAMFDANGGAHVALWQGESGCPSQPSTIEALADTPVNEDIQAKVAIRSIMTDLAAGVDYTCYFTFSDFKYYYRNGLIPKPTHFGLVTADDPPRTKPAYGAFRNLCTLLDGDTALCDDIKLGIELEPFPPAERFTFQELQIRLKTACFRRKGFPFLAFWNPVDLIPEVAGNPPWRCRDVMLQIWTPGKPLAQPVLIDPMSGDVFEPEGVRQPSSRTIVIPAVPIKDYPMILTDCQAVEGDVRLAAGSR